MNIKFVSNSFLNHDRMLRVRVEERIPVVFADGGMTINLWWIIPLALLEAIK